MATVTETPSLAPEEPKVELVEEDGETLESDWHRIEMNVLIDSVKHRLGDRQDFYAGGNMFIYYSLQMARKRDFRGPDFFYVKGVSREPIRRYWVVWEEGGKYPDVIIELLSPKTAKEDLGVKRDVYEQTFRTSEYFCYDPDTQELLGWRLIGGRYQPIQPDARGWLYCEQLGLWLGTWRGKISGNEAVWLRFHDADGAVVLLAGEAERQRADIEHERAETEHLRAEAERQRREAVEAELAQLRAQIAKKQGDAQT